MILVVRRGRLLAIRRSPFVSDAGYWTFPTGRVEPGESQRHTVRREAQEELGIEVEPTGKVWECGTDDGRFLLHWWTTRCPEQPLRLKPDEVAAARWVDPTAFARLRPTFVGDRRFVRTVLPHLKLDGMG